jgi:protein O-mannosyl-transferase
MGLMVKRNPTIVTHPATEESCAWKSQLLALALVLVTVVTYAPIWRAGFIWDDDAHVTENVNLRSVTGLWRIWTEPQASQQYYPLSLTTHWIEYQLWGLHPFGYHVVNVLLHALNAVLLWIVLRQLKIPGAWFATAIFALHPVEVESVAWISERKNVLSATFYFLAMLAYFRLRPLTDDSTTKIFNTRAYALVVILFLCALLSKTTTATLPAVLLLLTWWKTGRVEKRDAWTLAPLFALGAGLGLATAWLEKYHVGATGAQWSLSAVGRCLVAGRALWFYAGKLFWPGSLAFIYPHWEINSTSWSQYVFPVTALAMVVVLWRQRRRLGKGPLVAVLIFAGTLFPALGFIDVYPFLYSYVADHFQYLASAALITLAASAAATCSRQMEQIGPRIVTVAGTSVLVLLAILTWKRTGIYQDPETLWADTLSKNPSCWMAYNNMGTLLLQRSKIEEAIGQYERALQIKPDIAVSHNSLANALLQEGRVQEAIEHYEQAVRIAPDYAEAHYSLGVALAKVDRVHDALGHYEQALRVKPDYAEAHNNLGGALIEIGRVPEGIEHFQQALRINPDYADAHSNLGAALFLVGKVEEAIGQFEQALRVKPDDADAHGNLGNALLQAGRIDDAIMHLTEAVRVDPQFVEAHYNLGKALEQKGMVNEAIVEYERVLQIKPDFAGAQTRLAQLKTRQGL